MTRSAVLLIALACTCCGASIAAAAPTESGQVAFALSANSSLATAAPLAAACSNPCWVAGSDATDCKQTCEDRCQSSGTGVYTSREVCCSPGVAFPGGCVERPSQCWVVESFSLRTCVRDDRKCLQGFGVFGSETICCAAGAAFPDGCAAVTLAATPCYIVDTYWPSRQCRASTTLCGPDAGMQSFDTKEACCARGGAFSEGCSEYAPVTPCWLIDSYYPQRTCTQSNDVAVCNRGWGVFQSQEVCCARGTAFPEGCSQTATGGNSSNTTSAANSPAPAAVLSAVQPPPAAEPNTTQPANVSAALPASTTPPQIPVIVSTTPLASTNGTVANTTPV